MRYNSETIEGKSVMFAPSKERVAVYNFSVGLDHADEIVLSKAIMAMWFATHQTMNAPEITFFNVLDTVAFSEALTPDRLESLLKACGMTEAIVQRLPYFLILPQESSVAVALVLELFRRSGMQCFPTIIRSRQWFQHGVQMNVFEAISLNEIITRSE